MEAAKRLAGVYLAAVGVAVGVHFVLDPLIYDWADGNTPPLWIVLDWLMAAGFAVALIATFHEKRRADAGADLREFLTANVSFYLAVGLALAFLWNAVQIGWAAGDQTPDGQVWVVIDTVLPPLFAAAGIRLWRAAAA